MAQLSSIAAATEVDAVNVLLSTIGEAPLADQTELDAATSVDVTSAVIALKNSIRNLCMLPWKFNTEREYALTAAATHTWIATDDGDDTAVGIFTVPTNLLAFTTSLRADQQGSKYTDATIRLSRQYQSGGNYVLVFADRATGRDGFPTADRTYLYIDPVWHVLFANLPETAKTYVMANAGRVWQQGLVGSDVLRAFTADDERLALRALKRDQGQPDDYNMLMNTDVSKHLGMRPRGVSGVGDLRTGHLGLL
jgi:hypothetical protein